ncbi:MAG: hypothetical protein ABSA64_05335 [Sedimentisphaerales bacterium]
MTETNIKKYPATVVKIIDEYTIVINRGDLDGVKLNQLFLIYILSDKEIIDPETNENLGYLELVRGRGKVCNVQERLSTIKSVMKENPTHRIIKRSPLAINVFSYMGQSEEEITEQGEILPFNGTQVGDKAKPI